MLCLGVWGSTANINRHSLIVSHRVGIHTQAPTNKVCQLASRLGCCSQSICCCSVRIRSRYRNRDTSHRCGGARHERPVGSSGHADVKEMQTPRPRSSIYYIPPPAGVTAAESIPYRDSKTDIAFINMCRRAYGSLAGWQSSAAWDEGPASYRGMIEVSRALMKGKTAAQQREAVVAGFPKVPPWFRALFPYTSWGAELNAAITPTFFSWLVGPMQRVEVELPDGTRQHSGVHIQRCRYLAESGCAGMCVNLCKSPTQAFFSEQLGMPLTMEPNFEDFSCDMVFGRQPPPLENDVAAQQSCLAGCPAAVAVTKSSSEPWARCHKLTL